VIVDDHLAFAEGVSAVLRSRSSWTVEGIATTGRQALRLCEETAVDVVLLDLELPDLHGLEVARELKGCSPRSRILLVTAYANPSYVLRAQDLGVAGYLLKADGMVEILDAIRRALLRRTTYSSGIEGVARALSTVDDADEQRTGITGRQRAVLRLVASGLSVARAADELGIRERTARLHWYGALDRLGLRTLGPIQVSR
jgi:DNA-binding NarL/FixJ family response regulator